MATDLKRFSISVTPSMEESLNKVKQERYCQNTRNDMIRDLILRGLVYFEQENTVKENSK